MEVEFNGTLLNQGGIVELVDETPRAAPRVNLMRALIPEGLIEPENRVCLVFSTRPKWRVDLTVLAPIPTPSPRRILTTLQKDNRIEWIQDWIQWYAHHYSIDQVILYDNNSSYQGSLEGQLVSSVPIQVVPWNAPYGLIVNGNHSNWFTQHGSLNHCALKYLNPGDVLFNFDIDELLVCPIDLLGRALASNDCVFVDSYWVPALDRHSKLPSYSFRDFRHRETEPRQRSFKYVVRWKPGTQLDIHRVRLRGRSVKLRLEQGCFLHYRAINTDWKGEHRLQPSQSRALQPLPNELFEAW